MDLLLDAALNMECGTFEQLVQATGGVMKIGDIVSDVFFVVAIEEYASFVSFDAHNFIPILVAAILFTLVGVLFDLIKLTLVLRDRRRIKILERELQNVPDEEKKRNWKWWKRSNFVFEEFPQLVIAVAFVLLIDQDCLDGCDQQAHDDARDKAFNSAIVSVLFTSFSLLTTLYLWIKQRRAQAADQMERDDFLSNISRVGREGYGCMDMERW